MSHADTPAAPSFTPEVRTRAYVGTLVTTTASLLILGVLVVLDVLTPVKALAVHGIVTTACAYLAGGLGTAYRPTALPGQ